MRRKREERIAIGGSALDEHVSERVAEAVAVGVLVPGVVGEALVGLRVAVVVGAVADLELGAMALGVVVRAVEGGGGGAGGEGADGDGHGSVAVEVAVEVGVGVHLLALVGATVAVVVAEVARLGGLRVHGEDAV